MVFHSGSGDYKYSMDFAELFSEPELIKTILYQPFQLIDINEIYPCYLKMLELSFVYFR